MLSSSLTLYNRFMVGDLQAIHLSFPSGSPPIFNGKFQLSSLKSQMQVNLSFSRRTSVVNQGSHEMQLIGVFIPHGPEIRDILYDKDTHAVGGEKQKNPI